MEFLKDIKKGIGIMFGMILVLGILFGVYAFVEPTQSPTAGNNYINSASPVGKVQWAGYTTLTYNGNLQGVIGATNICDSNFAGSRAMTYDDLLYLGKKYPRTSAIWLIDGSYQSFSSGAAYEISKDGASIVANAYGTSQCTGWTSTGNYGSAIQVLSNSVSLMACTNVYKLGCVY